MIQETRQCQNCKTPFDIGASDFEFYAKIKVPAPTFCPDCRLQRKMARRNERSLYSRQCDYCHANIISMYPRSSTFKVYCNACWWSDNWDSLDFAQAYDFSKSFFAQFEELTRKVPRQALYQKNPVNSPYTNHSDNNKNCYLAFNNGMVEDLMYSKWMAKSREANDCYGCFNSEVLYESQDPEKCAKSEYLLYCNDCYDSAFLYNCKGCGNCFLSSNLRNKNYYFANQPLSKEEYFQKISELDLGNYKNREDIKTKFFNEILPLVLRKFSTFSKVVNSTGDNLYECKNLKNSFHVYESEDSAYCIDNANLKDCYDTYEAAFNCERQYDCHACNRTSRAKFASISYDNHDIEYAEVCHNSSNLFGCVGLRKKEYCILNKQYAKEEYEELVPKIIKHMNVMPYVDKKGRIYKYGEFFPPELSPFAYNETIAQEYFPLTKERAIAQGYKWKEPEPRNFQFSIINSQDLPDHIKDVTDDILNQVIGCEHVKDPPAGGCNEQCTTAFKIIKAELEFYRKMNLPLPRLCPNCRHYQRIKQRNPLRLWHRKCMCQGAQTNADLTQTDAEKNTYQNTSAHFHGEGHCENEFQTTYSPERPEIVYCEACYNQEVV